MYNGITLVPGKATGALKFCVEPISFWGGFDTETGKITDAGHPDVGQSLANKVLLMSHAKGSSSSSSVIVEAVRRNTFSSAVLLNKRDLIVSIGAIVARELYNVGIPVVILENESFLSLSKYSGTVLVSANDEGRSGEIHLID
jgi:predicted aconitase with swiveling domain